MRRTLACGMKFSGVCSSACRVNVSGRFWYLFNEPCGNRGSSMRKISFFFFLRESFPKLPCLSHKLAPFGLTRSI